MENIVRLNSDRRHEVVKYLTMGFGYQEVAEFFDMPVASVKRIYEDHLNNDPTPPSVA